MAEGLSAGEVGKEISEHKHAAGDPPKDRRDRLLTVTEALLLSLVAVLAAYSGYAAAKWGRPSLIPMSGLIVPPLVWGDHRSRATLCAPASSMADAPAGKETCRASARPAALPRNPFEVIWATVVPAASR
jgi:hypothetical protein